MSGNDEDDDDNHTSFPKSTCGTLIVHCSKPVLKGFRQQVYQAVWLLRNCYLFIYFFVVRNIFL